MACAKERGPSSVPARLCGVVRHAVQTPAHSSGLEAVELCAVPVAALRVVADGVARAQTDPVRERAVRLAQVAHEALHTESLVGAHCQKKKVTGKNKHKKTQTKKDNTKMKKEKKGQRKRFGFSLVFFFLYNHK